MNNKRQTIWLVSMLSLMVILSAYYLFTEDTTPQGKQAQQSTSVTDATKTSGTIKDDGVQVTQIDSAGAITDPTTDGKDSSGVTKDKDQGAAAKPDTGKSGAAASPDQGKEAAASPDAGKTGTSGTVPDKDVLKGMTNLTGREFFDDIQLKREQAYSKRSEELDAIVGNNTTATQAEAQQAIEEQSRMDATEARISSLEEKLLGDFENAVVQEEDSNFKVVVQAAKLDPKQAVKIVSLATKELQVTPDHVSVQFVQ